MCLGRVAQSDPSEYELNEFYKKQDVNTLWNEAWNFEPNLVWDNELTSSDDDGDSPASKEVATGEQALE